jgi:uncharacterized protein (DUF779 family)
MVNRVEITDKAVEIVERLKAQHGALMFHQSGGCCDGSAPMCYPVGDFRVGPQDVLLGKIAGCDFYIGAAQFEYWQHTQLIIDVGPRLRVFRRSAGRRQVFDAQSSFHGRGSCRARSGRPSRPRSLISC